MFAFSRLLRPRGREFPMSRMVFVLALGSLGAAAGCATLSVEERTAFCTNTDWYRYGVNDGTLGVPSSERGGMIADCAELGRPVDVIAYQAGRAEGLSEYCTVESGYEVGLSGRGYRNVCPPDLQPDFLQGYAQGDDERPDYWLSPGFGIGIGAGAIGIGGIGIGSFYDDCFYADPFYCGWRRPWGYRSGYDRYRYPYWNAPAHPRKEAHSKERARSHAAHSKRHPGSDAVRSRERARSRSAHSREGIRPRRTRSRGHFRPWAARSKGQPGSAR